MKHIPSDRSTPLSNAFAALYELARYLRSEQGCPWDRSQDLESICKHLREELEELREAITADDKSGFSEEWGDVLFILLMLGVIAEETGKFAAEHAMRSVETKMIRRHPHVFGSSDVDAVEDILDQWQRIKKEEKNSKTQSLMENLPSFYSSLKRADHVQRTAAGVGFDWPDISGVLDKVQEELSEVREMLTAGDMTKAGKELGDLLFSCVNLARFLHLDADTQLSKTVDKFIDRFRYIECELRRNGRSVNEASLKEMDELWEKAKSEDDRSGA